MAVKVWLCYDHNFGSHHWGGRSISSPASNAMLLGLLDYMNTSQAEAYQGTTLISSKEGPIICNLPLANSGEIVFSIEVEE